MKKLVYLILLLAIGLLLVGCQRDAITPTSLAEEIEHQVNPYIIFGSKASVVVGIIRDEEEAIYAFGQKDLQRGGLPNRHTVYEIGSITKTFTGTLLAQMHLKGQINLIDSIEQYLRGIPVPTYEGKSITLENLATHTSSLPRQPTNFDEFVEDTDNPYQFYTVEALYSFLASYPLAYPPGTEFEYSNVGVDLLGHILGKAVGSDYETAIMQEITTPLNMDNTTLSLNEIQRANMAEPHHGKNIVSYWEANDATQASGAVISDMNDMLLYLKANMGLVPNPLQEAIELAQTPHFKINTHLSVGLNWFVRTEDNNREIVWHNGGTGGFETFIGFDKTAHRGVIILTNTLPIGGSATELGFDILKVITDKY